ncbi:hypothetical protein [Rhizobium leguminosarum]|uniref:hypothetical protein n=1 Tax=Rhizobium leguminosarum TaxID=384 RepID=UPI003F955ADE
MPNAGHKTIYLIPPILVNDLASQCAAYFLIWFSDSSAEHITDILRAGHSGSGGLIEEVEYWMENCSEDAARPNGGAGYWDIEVDGPWTYTGLNSSAVATEIQDHTRGWTATDFGNYGLRRDAP